MKGIIRIMLNFAEQSLTSPSSYNHTTGETVASICAFTLRQANYTYTFQGSPFVISGLKIKYKKKSNGINAAMT